MDLDNILYIVIAVALAIINAVVQKKKKTAQQQAKPTMEKRNPLSSILEELENEEPEIATIFANRNTILDQPSEVVLDQVPEPIEKNEYLDSIENFKEPTPLDVLSHAQFEPVDNLKSPIDIPITDLILPMDYDYNSLENSISSSSITDVLSDDEEAEKRFKAQSIFVQEFDVKKAILYAEIIKPKYF